MARISVFLIVVALIAGMVGCGGGNDVVRYDITISSASGGSVTTPGMGTYTYDAGTVINLVATPDIGYQFDGWTGDVSTVADVNAATTNITMNDDCVITANFVIETPPSVPEIRTWYDLDAIRNNLSGDYILMNNLDSTTPGYEELVSPTANEGKGWEPIGTENYPFTGTFNGQGYEIGDLFINRPDEDNVGLYGCFGQGCVIQDISVVNVSVTGNGRVGGLAGTNYCGWGGIVSNCYSTGNVTGDWEVGSLVGYNNVGCTVSNSYSTGSVAGNYSGGLVGLSNGIVSNSSSACAVSGDYDVGGLVGNSGGTVSSSYATGSVTGGGWIGGLVGEHCGTVSDSYSTGSVTGNALVGGLAGGILGGTVGNCYSTGGVAGNSTVGGLVADSNGDAVTNSFWDTEASGQATSAGGTGKNTTEMKDITTFSAWSIIGVANPSLRNLSYIWNIVDDVTYPFLSWQP
jgi:uncharacterized repeat protein (TIGR02543 family)